MNTPSFFNCVATSILFLIWIKVKKACCAIVWVKGISQYHEVLSIFSPISLDNLDIYYCSTYWKLTMHCFHGGYTKTMFVGWGEGVRNEARCVRRDAVSQREVMWCRVRSKFILNENDCLIFFVCLNFSHPWWKSKELHYRLIVLFY